MKIYKQDAHIPGGEFKHRFDRMEKGKFREQIACRKKI